MNTTEKLQCQKLIDAAYRDAESRLRQKWKKHPLNRETEEEKSLDKEADRLYAKQRRLREAREARLNSAKNAELRMLSSIVRDVRSKIWAGTFTDKDHAAVIRKLEAL